MVGLQLFDGWSDSTRIFLLLLILNIKDFDGTWFIVLLFAAILCAALTLLFSKKGTDAYEVERLI